jgi:hypothetical protein
MLPQSVLLSVLNNFASGNYMEDVVDVEFGSVTTFAASCALSWIEGPPDSATIARVDLAYFDDDPDHRMIMIYGADFGPFGDPFNYSVPAWTWTGTAVRFRLIAWGTDAAAIGLIFTE